MKKIILFSFICFLNSTLLISQSKSTKDVAITTKQDIHLKVFNQAVTSGDIASAAVALNYYITEHGSNSPYADTLAMLYMQQGSFPQCYFWANKRLETKPNDISLMEMKGICLDKLQQPKEAIDLFEKLFTKTQSPYHAYKLMELQYSIKRLTECLATAQAAEKLIFKPEYVMTYNIGQQTGRTYLQAGVYNIHALTLYDLDKKSEAKNYFEKALALDSSFALAKQNLEAMRSIEKGGSQTSLPTNNQPTLNPANKQN